MEDKDYRCTNGAYHENYCCKTCWNRHPENEKGAMFVIRFGYKYKQILEDMHRKRIIKDAISSGFTFQQADFLYRLKTEV